MLVAVPVDVPRAETARMLGVVAVAILVPSPPLDRRVSATVPGDSETLSFGNDGIRASMITLPGADNQVHRREGKDQRATEREKGARDNQMDWRKYSKQHENFADESSGVVEPTSALLQRFYQKRGVAVVSRHHGV